MSALLWLPFTLPLVMAVCFPLLYVLLVMFLYQGARCFRLYRLRLAAAQVCIDCGREILAPGARFCGKCGGKLRKAA